VWRWHPRVSGPGAGSRALDFGKRICETPVIFIFIFIFIFTFTG